MRIPKYLKEQPGLKEVIEKHNLENLDNNEIVQLISKLELEKESEKNFTRHYQSNFERVANINTKNEKTILEFIKQQLINAKLSVDVMCDYLHRNLNSRVYHKYECAETDLTFWEWVELRDYVEYKEVLEDFWQLKESYFMSKIRDGRLTIQDFIFKSPR